MDTARAPPQDTPEERWARVRDPQLKAYWASSLGRIWNPRSGAVLRGHKSRAGYMETTLATDDLPSKTVFRRIHRLVASAFLQPATGQVQVDHINRIRDDNRLENLRWVSPSENCGHKVVSPDRKGPKCPIIQLDRDGKTVIKEWPSSAAAACAFGINPCQIRKVTCGERKAVAGFAWKRKDDLEIEGEQWKVVALAHGHNVEVSDYGRVKGVNGHVLGGYTTDNGYVRVEVRKRNFFVHQLVARAFLGPQPAGTTVDHRNRDRKDNRIANLRYATATEQNENRIHPERTIRSRTVEVTHTISGATSIYKSITTASRATGVDVKTIRIACNRHDGRATRKPFAFRFVQQSTE